jgi:hypothetical protein
MRKNPHNPGAEIMSFPTARRAEASGASSGSRQPASGSSAVALTGAAAVELYVSEMDRNLDALDAQLALLREAFSERARLLREGRQAFSERSRLLREALPGGPADEMPRAVCTAPDDSSE